MSEIANHLRYRPEVDGLRALAVVPVILFHAGFELFSGGFVGVDISFVISGYLITTIILSEKAYGRFSIAGFYERRARRILPALFFVIVVCLPFAWMWMTPAELRGFSTSILGVNSTPDSSPKNINLYQRVTAQFAIERVEPCGSTRSGRTKANLCPGTERQLAVQAVTRTIGQSAKMDDVLNSEFVWLGA